MDSIGRYKIVKELGRGATGSVYHAVDPNIGRPVAIKVIQFAAAGEDVQERLRERLLREARSVGRLSHPAIITIYDVEQESDLAYIIMEYVDGATLKDVLARPNPITRETMFQVLRQTASGLDYAHQRGVVHRDIKPANIMIAWDGSTKIADFGVAKIKTAESISASGAIVGTPQYMAPEQVQGQNIDGRCDEYALALLTYEMLTGVRPFSGETMGAVGQRILHEEPTEAHRINASLSPEISRVISKGMAKSPEARYVTCQEFVDSLEKACGSCPGWKVMTRGTPGQEWHTADGMVFPMAPAPEPKAPLPTPPREARAPAPMPSFSAVDAPIETDGVAKRKRQVWPFVLAALLPGALAGLVFWHPQSDAGTAAPDTTTTSPISPKSVPDVPKEPHVTMPAPVPDGYKVAAPASAVPVAPRPITAPKQAVGRPIVPREQDVPIRTIPVGAAVELDGQYACATPCNLSVARGRHNVTIRLGGYYLERREVNVGATPAEIADIVLRPIVVAPGSLVIPRIPDGANLYINDKRYEGGSPATIRLAPGTYRIVTELNGVRSEKTIELASDGLQVLSITVSK